METPEFSEENEIAQANAEQDVVQDADNFGESDVDDVPAVDDLTLAEFSGRFLRAPRSSLREFMKIAAMPVNEVMAEGLVSEIELPSSEILAEVDFASLDNTPTNESPIADEAPLDSILIAPVSDVTRLRVKVGLYVVAFFVALIGCMILAWAGGGWRSEDKQLVNGMPFLLLGFGIWLAAEVYGSWPEIQARRQKKDDQDFDGDKPTGHEEYEPVSPASWWQKVDMVRAGALAGALLFSIVAWNGTSDNIFSFDGFWGWVASIILVVIAFAPQEWTIFGIWRDFSAWLGGIRWRGNWTLWAMIAIMLVGGYFRFYDLDGMPLQMTSDHKEKILDAQRVLDGNYQVFFPNNGGREPIQMYAMALLSHFPGLGINHFTLKVLAVIESMMTLPLLWWMGREVIGERDRKLGNLVGLTLMALAAASYWHVAITRQALRIPLTPLFAALLLIFLSRAMRHNRRSDYVLSGLILGVGLYAYQAIRMLPVVVLVGVGLAMLFHLHDRRELRRYLGHLAVLIMVSFIVFVPLFRFSMDYPDLFWRRTAGRLFGDSLVEEVDNEGNLVQRESTFSEQLDAFGDNMSVFSNNIRNAFLMFNWKGDVGWINGVPNDPQMDVFSGALLVVGLAAWFALMIRQRDPVYLLVPVMLFIMLMPSALSIAMPRENPSSTRASGALPAVYLLSAFPLVLIAMGIPKAFSNKKLPWVSLGIIVLVWAGSYTANINTYFNEYRARYNYSTWPYSEPGEVMREFVADGGDYGNAFLVYYDSWWDYTIVGMEAGIMDWPNGILNTAAVPDFLRDAYYCAGRDYPVDPDKGLLFFYREDDPNAEDNLKEWFPGGYSTFMQGIKAQYNFMIYRVPALGVVGWELFIAEYAEVPTCQRG